MTGAAVGAGSCDDRVDGCVDGPLDGLVVSWLMAARQRKKDGQESGTQAQPATKAHYMAGLGDEQFDWLKSDLAAVAPVTPVMIVSHIPIYSIAVLNGDLKDETGATRVPKGGMHTDYKRLKDLFRRHRNVKLAVSGHLHLNERIEYAGMTYLCNGAVSGDGWKGPTSTSATRATRC